LSRHRVIRASGLAAAAITVLAGIPAEASPGPGPDAERYGLAQSNDQTVFVVEPFSRGRRARERDGFERDQAPPAEESEPAKRPMPCPEDRWSLPVQIKGVACVLLLPKPDEPASDAP
jgi:hypothetical protein